MRLRGIGTLSWERCWLLVRSHFELSSERYAYPSCLLLSPQPLPRTSRLGSPPPSPRFRRAHHRRVRRPSLHPHRLPAQDRSRFPSLHPSSRSQGPISPLRPHQPLPRRPREAGGLPAIIGAGADGWRDGNGKDGGRWPLSGEDGQEASCAQLEQPDGGRRFGGRLQAY